MTAGIGGSGGSWTDRGSECSTGRRVARPDPFRGQRQDHRDLIEVETSNREAVRDGRATNGPTSPRPAPGRAAGAPGSGTAHRCCSRQPFLGSRPRAMAWWAEPAHRPPRRSRGALQEAGLACRPPSQPIDLGGMTMVRGSSSTATSVSHRTTSPSGSSLGQSEGAGHFVAVGGSGIERLYRAHRHAAGPQIEEGIRGVRSHDVDHQVTRVDPDDGGERRKPTKRVKVEPRMCRRRRRRIWPDQCSVVSWSGLTRRGRWTVVRKGHRGPYPCLSGPRRRDMFRQLPCWRLRHRLMLEVTGWAGHADLGKWSTGLRSE